MKTKPARPTRHLLPIYRRALAKYEAEGKAERAAIERRLIKRLEARA